MQPFLEKFSFAVRGKGILQRVGMSFHVVSSEIVTYVSAESITQPNSVFGILLRWRP